MTASPPPPPGDEPVTPDCHGQSSASTSEFQIAGRVKISSNCLRNGGHANSMRKLSTSRTLSSSRSCDAFARLSEDQGAIKEQITLGSGTLKNFEGKEQTMLLQNLKEQARMPIRSGISKASDSNSTWPIVKDRLKSSAEACTSKHAEFTHSSRQRTLRYSMEARGSRFNNPSSRESMRSDFVLDTPVVESRFAMQDFRAKLERLAAEQGRPKPETLPARKPGYNRLESSKCKSPFALEKLRLEENLEKLDAKLGSQFESLVCAIDGVTKQVQTAFQGLHETMDGLQRSLEADRDSGWNKLKDHIDQQLTPLTYSRKQDERWTDSLQSLKEATERARGSIKTLTGILIAEKDAEMMRLRDFQDRQTMLMKMTQPYLKKPAFEQFWHIKHGLDHCVASVLFKTSNILARTQSVMGNGSSGSKLSEGDYDEAQFKRFYKKGQKGLEAFAQWEEKNWSGQLKKGFLIASKGVWQLQSMVATTMLRHQVEYLQHDPGSRFDQGTMDALDHLAENHFQPVVQFTIFPGFKVDGLVVIKSQVYLQPRSAAARGAQDCEQLCRLMAWL